MRYSRLYQTSYLMVCGSLAVGCSDDGAATESDTEAVSTGGGDSLSTTTAGSMTSTTGNGDGTSTTASTTAADTGSTDAGTTDTGITDTAGTTGDATGSTGDGSSGSSETGVFVLPDFSGEFLFVASAVIAPDLPFQYIATVDVTLDGGGGALMDLELQPLSLDVGSTTAPREPFGPPLSFDDVVVAEDGTFTVDIGALSVAGATNPITGSDLELENIVFSGDVLDEDTFCGAFDGQVTVPIAVDLSGSTFAAIGVLDTTPANLPATFPLGCP